MNSSHCGWILPASIPFSELKARDLEECLYWLFDALGAKDLEWRTGGSGGGASDGGRDLEAHFYTPTADQEMEPQVWWVECKGRSGTVEADEVKRAIINAQARVDLDYVVIATNTQFSNPTRDWVREWQMKNSRPKIKLWDSAHLERLLSRHPEVVLRLFSEALSLKGQAQALESRFWNKLEYVPSATLERLWKERAAIEFASMCMFALIANEMANGSIVRRPWGTLLETDSLIEVLQTGLINLPYLVIRGAKGGVEQSPITRAHAYLILCALDKLPSEQVANLIVESITRGKTDKLPQHVQEYLLMPIADQLLSEIREVCSADCKRIINLNRRSFTESDEDIERYWLRLEPAAVVRPNVPEKHVRIESLSELCQVGFPVDKEHNCPLFETTPSVKEFSALMGIIKGVAAYRKRQAAKKRSAQDAMS